VTNNGPEFEIPNDPNVSPADIQPAADLQDADLTDALLVGADLTDALLVGADLANANLRDADLTNANLRDADLTDAFLVGADLTDALLVGADLTDADLHDVDLTNANLRDADLTDALLLGADLTDANLTDANLTGTGLDENTIVTDNQLTTAEFDYNIPYDNDISPSDIVLDADLTNANLRDADLTDANLRDADLTNANLWDVDLTNANLQDANLTDAELLDADLTDALLMGADLTNAELLDADLTNANLQDANLTDAYLYDADLTDALLVGADLTDAELLYADLSGTNLDGTDLSGATLRYAGFDTINMIDTPSELLPTSTLFGSVPSLIDAEVDWRDTPVEECFRIPVPGYGNPASFVEAELRRADLEGAKLNYADLTEAALTAADCENVQFNEANLQRATLENADLSGTDFSDAYLYQTQFDGARINEETQFHPDGEVGDTKTDNACRFDSKVPPQTAVDSIAGNAEADLDVDVEEVRARQARSTYTRLEDLARKNGFPDLRSEMYIRRQDARRELLWAQGEKLRAVFAQIQKSLFNYGESFRRIVEISVAAIVIAWMLFMTTGTVENAAGVAVTPDVVIDNPILIWETLYHSLSVFFAGQGPLSPIGTPGQVLTVFLRGTGPILVALLIFVLGRRAAR